MTKRGEVPKFVEAVLRAETDDCIMWPYSVLANGYPDMRIGGHTVRVTMLVCERTHGPRPGRADAAHSCGVRTCVNPRHLRWTTRKDNEADKIAHGTKRAGSSHYRAQLTDAQVSELRARHAAGGVTQSALAAEYGVDQSNISRIVRGRTYK